MSRPAGPVLLPTAAHPDLNKDKRSLLLAGKVKPRRNTTGAGCVAYNPDGKRLASASRDGTVKVWEALPPE